MMPCSKGHPVVHVRLDLCKKISSELRWRARANIAGKRLRASAFSFALFAASIPLSRQRRMRKKGNYLNTKRRKEEGKNFCGIHNSTPETFRETAIPSQKSAGSRSVRRFFFARPIVVVVTVGRGRGRPPYKFDVPQNTYAAAFYPFLTLSSLPHVRPVRPSVDPSKRQNGT